MWITRKNMLSMGISHWQYAWSFYSCVYLADIYLVDIFTGNCHFWHIFRALCILTFCAGIVLEHSFLTLSNVACPSDMYNLDIFPGHIFFGHISRTIIFLDILDDKTTSSSFSWGVGGGGVCVIMLIYSKANFKQIEKKKNLRFFFSKIFFFKIFFLRIFIISTTNPWHGGVYKVHGKSRLQGFVKRYGGS